jgi:hypothetical protein
VSSRIAAAALAWLALWACAAPAWAEARWLRAESANFVVHTDADRRTAERYVAQLETFDRVLRLAHAVKADEPVRRKLPIYVLKRAGDMRRIRPGIPSGVRGFYASSLEDTFAVAIAEGGGNDPTLQHEYVHHFMLNRYPFGYPAWLIEGYAEYYMTFKETPKYLEVGNYNANRATWLSRSRWLPMETVLKARPSELRRPEDIAMFYAQSWALTHWFLSEPARSAQLSAYVRAVGQGAEPLKAMTDATGQTPAALSRTLEKYLTRGFPYKRFSLPPAAVAPPTVTELSPAASDLLLLTLRLKGDNGIDAPEDRTDGPVLFADVRKAAASHPGDRLSDLALARAEIKLGEPSRAEPLLQRRLAADANDVEALQLLGQARLRAAAAAEGEAARTLKNEAASFIGRAYKVDPDNYQTLILAAQAREGSRNYPNENDVNVLLDALDLAPTVRALRVNAAQVLAERGRAAEAANVLRPLAFDPHGGQAATAARALIALLESGAKAPASGFAAAVAE